MNTLLYSKGKWVRDGWTITALYQYGSGTNPSVSTIATVRNPCTSNLVAWGEAVANIDLMCAAPRMLEAIDAVFAALTHLGADLADHALFEQRETLRKVLCKIHDIKIEEPQA